MVPGLPHPVTLSISNNCFAALQAVREGDFSTRLPGHWSGIDGKIADAFNDVITTNQKIAEELERVGSDRRQGRPNAVSRQV